MEQLKSKNISLAESAENAGKPKEKDFEVTRKKSFDLPVFSVNPVRDKAFDLIF